MKWWMWIAVCLIAVSCSAPEPPESWSAQRATPSSDQTGGDTAVCEEIRTLALGSLADDPDLSATLDELARIGAVVGATAALPLLTEVRSLAPTTDAEDPASFATRHDRLVAAAIAIDDATAVACEIPAFSALYAASGFPDCHFEMELPVAAHVRNAAPDTCTGAGRPTFLPCWSTDGNHLPVDCVSGEIVEAAGERWEPAGPPQRVSIDRTFPLDPDAPLAISLVGDSACAAIADLFRGEVLPNGVAPDFALLGTAAAGLDQPTRDLVDRFIEANAATPDFDEFEALVTELDHATANRCGLPIVSAWVSISETVDQLPCWTETGLSYPAYEQTDCR